MTLFLYLVAAANSQAFSRILVQKTSTQLFEYNHDEADQ